MGNTISNKLNLRWTFVLLLAAFSVMLSFALLQTNNAAAQVGGDRFAPVEYYELESQPELNPGIARIASLYGTSVRADGVNANGYVINNPGSSFIKVHFSEMTLANGDTVTVSNPAGTQSFTYPGAEFTYDDEPGFWAMSIFGDTAIVRLNSANGGSVVVTDTFSAGYSEAAVEAAMLQAESTCAGLERRDVVCHADSNPMEYDTSDAAARIIINSSGACTAWRVGPENHMLTNNHCIETQTDATNTEVQFGYQRASSDCLDIDSTNSPTPSVALQVSAQTLLSTDSFHDYTLFTLTSSGFTSAQSYGYLRLDDRTPANGEQIYIPQHGGAKPKQFGIESDQDTDNLCRVVTGITMFGRSDKVFYRCDTTGGSSGSPVLSTSTNAVVGLHNWGTGISNGANCTTNAVANSGGRISDIYPLISGFFSTTSPVVPSTPMASATDAVISWNDTGAEYEVLVTDSGGGTAYRNFYRSDDVCGADCSADFSSLSDGSYTFYVRAGADSVLAFDDVASAWSSGVAFSVGSGGVQQPVRMHPAAGDMLDDPSDYDWQKFSFEHIDGVEWYQVWIGASDYATPAAVFQWYEAAQICSGSTCTLPTDVWLSNGTYSWWMTYWGPSNQDINSYWNESTFTVDFAAPSSTFSMTSPMGTVNNDPSAIEWTRDQATLWYQVWVGPADYSTSQYFDWFNAAAECSSTTCSLDVSGASFPDGNYEVWVQMWGPNGFVTWPMTPSGEFSVSSAAAITP